MSDVGDEISTGEFDKIGFEAGMMWLLLREEPGEPRKVELVEVLVGESVEMALWPDSMTIGDSKGDFNFHGSRVDSTSLRALIFALSNSILL